MTDRIPRSLPPLVDGNVYGHLLVTIDEVLWCKKFSNEVIVLLQWWGDIDSVTFRPPDIAKYPDTARSCNSVRYNIQTNLALFETYLKQCNKLKLLVVNDDSKEIIGHVEISSLYDHITKIQLQKYFPIVTSSGSRIGDLRVDFELSMNSVPEETSKKTRKRSRRKTKLASNSFRTAVEEDNSKQFKKGCNTCSNHIKNPKKTQPDNFLNFEMPESPKTIQAPPNTGRSDKSDYVLLDVLEKGKKLRDAMVLSVLEDSDVPVDVNEELLLKIDNNVDKDPKSTYKSNSTTINGELVTPHEEKLISNYLEGKAMKEDEEKLVLTTLHSGKFNESANLEEKDHLKEANCCHSTKTSCLHSAPGQPATDTSDNHTSSTGGKNIGNLMKKINCFRLTIDSLTLTPAGWRKISQAVGHKNKNADNVPPPGATYFVECHFVEDSPRTQAQQWKVSPLRFCSRRQIEDVVYFGQSSAHPLKPPHSVDELEDVSCLVCWRHLHQRVPALLGRFKLAGVVRGLETEDTLPVVADNVTVVGHIKLKLQLGKDKLYFGNALLEDSPRDFKIEKKTLMERELGPTPRSEESPRLHVKDLENKIHPDVGKKTHEPKQTSTSRSHKGSYNTAQCRTASPSLVDIPLCNNCGQNLLLTKVQQTSADTSLCVSCSSLLGQHQSVVDPNFKISIPKNFTSKERRHHEFLIGIDTVKGFPLFANAEEELSCYVDYKFPQITPRLQAEMGGETTSRVVRVEPQPSLASVHRHSLPLPVVLPLSPLLAACSQGVTLRLWLRYYRPTPRDHMVAIALLPMDELCLMELEFDERQQEIAISKVLELPLALVPSSVTAPFQKCSTVGSLRVSITYSNFITPPPKALIDSTERPRETHEAPKVPVKDDLEVERDQTVQHELKPISALLDRITSHSSSPSEETLKEMKSKFWTGPFGKENVERDTGVLKSQELLSKQGDTVLKNHQPSKNIITSEPVNRIDSARESSFLGSSRPVIKEDLDILAESIEHRFNQLQSDLLKEKQRGLAEISSTIKDAKKANSSLNGELDDDFLSFHSPLSSNSSMDSLPFILGPPANFKDIQNTVACSKSEEFSESTNGKSDSDTIVGFFKEERDVANYGSNDSIDKNDCKPETIKPKTFKAMIKIDRAVNLKGVKAPSNGKKGKIPPSSWVSFGIGDCCEQNCGTNGLVCSGPRFTTPVIRRNHNPIWNLSWELDLPVEYLQQEEKRLVFCVFEEQLGVCVGRATASVAILRSGLPCLSTWLSIDDPQASCRGQLKVVVTPLEDLRHYQNCLVFDMEEDDFAEPKEKIPDSALSGNEKHTVPAFIASQTEVFLNEVECSPSKIEEAKKYQNLVDNAEANDDGEDPFLADDIISDYKNTLENNFRNEMAGLENLIKFLRVGSMTSELSFFRSTENKENLSSNPSPSPQFLGGETRTSSALECYSNVPHMRSASVNHQPLSHNGQKDRCVFDTTTESVDKGGFHSTSAHQSSEDLLSKLLQQISSFQPPAIKITDNTSQTSIPETKESFTETNDSDSPLKPETNTSVCMKDASTETEDITDKRTPRDNIGQVASRQVCEELGNMLLQHFLTCKPPPVKVTDGTTQTDCHDGLSTVNSSGVFMSGASVDMSGENFHGIRLPQSVNKSNWSKTEVQTSSERLAAIDSNIRDLERFFTQNSPPGSGNTSVDSVDELMEFNGKENSQSASDVESLQSYSQVMVLPLETSGDGDQPTLPQPQNPSNSDNTETLMRRRGTFVIDKPKQKPENSSERTSEGAD